MLKNLLTTSAVVMALALPATGALAQPATNPSPATPPAATAPHAAAPAASTSAATTSAATAQGARHMRDDQVRATKLIGSGIYDANDQKIGTVADLIVDRDGKISDVVIGVGGVMGAGEKHVAAPMSELKRGKDNHLVLSAGKDGLAKLASFDLSDTAKSGSSAHK